MPGATATAAPNYHGQLVAGQIDTITMSKDWSTIQVLATDGTARIDFTDDGSIPVEGGSPTGRVLPAAICVDVITVSSLGPTVIQLISPGTPHYSIIGGE